MELTTKYFLESIFKQYLIAFGGWIELRDKKTDGKIIQRFYQSIDEALTYQPEGNLYFGVCPRESNKSGKNDNIECLTTLWVDIDIGEGKPFTNKDEALENLKKFAFSPSIIVDSGNGLHAYWLLSKIETKGHNIKGILKGLAKAVKGDEKPINPAWMLRVPNTSNLKDPKNPKEVKILKIDSAISYDLKDFDKYIVPVSDAKVHEVSFSGEIKDVNIDELRIDQYLRNLIQTHVEKGERSEKDYAVICGLIEAGCDDDTIISIFYNNPIGDKFRGQGMPYLRHSIGKARGEIESKKKSKEVSEKPESENRNIILPFPKDLIPDGFIKEYVDYAEPLSEAPIQFHMANAFIIIAASCKRNIYLPFGAMNIYPNIYVLVIGKSGITRKTTAMYLAQHILNKVDPNSIFTSTMSLEGFYQELLKYPNKVCFYSEFKSFIENCSKKYGQGLITEFTRLWDCPDSFRINLKNLEDKNIVTEPSLSFISATTFDWLHLSEVDITGGFFGRFLPIVASDKREKYIAIPPKRDEAKINGLIDWARKISTSKGEFSIDTEAVDMIKKIYVEVWEDLDRLPNNNLFHSFWSRIQTNMLKLAMVRNISKKEPTLILDKDSIIWSHAVMKNHIVEYYKYIMGKVAFTEGMKLENKILDKLEEVRSKGISRSELLRYSKTDSKRFNDAINTLIDKELITAKVDKIGTKPKTTYYSVKYSPIDIG